MLTQLDQLAALIDAGFLVRTASRVRGCGHLFGNFNGTFIPSGEILEAHATWRINGGKGQFAQLTGAGTGKGVGTIVNGGPGPATILLDGSAFGAP